MGPRDDELDDEIRGHLAIEEQQRIERGEDPASARLGALKDFGNVTLTRDDIKSVWRPRWFETIDALVRDLKIAFRSLMRVKGLTATIVVTLALGIGANAAIFSVVRGVLLRPLVNRDETRLLYIRQGRPGASTTNLSFSVPEIQDIRSRTKTIAALGEFSTLDFNLIGLLGEPRIVKAGVVNGAFFDVMGLRPVLGRLIDAHDDGPKAAPVLVLTYRFWAEELNSDPSIIGRVVRLGPSAATVIGVLEPSVPYPTDTQLIANMVSSPHHLGATMVTNRTHRMTELFGRLAGGATIEDARAELASIETALVHEHPADYSKRAPTIITVNTLREQIASPARTILFVLLAAAAVIFIIACSNVANLILARSVRREGEVAVRAALGAGTGALRRTLLAESIVLCGAGALVGVVLARPLVGAIGQYAARYSIRALDVRVDNTVLFVGVGLAIAAAILLAYVPRLPSAHAPNGLGLASSGVRLTPGTNRRLRMFATVQIAFSFVLLAGASMLVTTLVTLQSANTGLDMQHVLVFDIPSAATGVVGPKQVAFLGEAPRRIATLPGVDSVAVGSTVPWRDAGSSLRIQFAVEGYTPPHGEDNPLADLRAVSPHFFTTLGVQILEGRDFNDDDVQTVIVNQTFAQRLFPNGDALNRSVHWTGSLAKMMGQDAPHRIVAVVADMDDEHLVREPTPIVYHTVRDLPMVAGRLFVRTDGDAYALVPAVTRTIRQLSPDQPVEHAATLEDVRAQVLSPERVNAFVFSTFAGIALLIAVVGVAGVLAFSVSARTREFGVRLAVGSAPRHILTQVVREGAGIAAVGIVTGIVAGFALSRVAARIIGPVQLPGGVAIVAATALLATAAIVASLMPAARASRVDVLQALRSE